MARKPDQAGPAREKQGRLHDEFIILSLNFVAGFGLLVPVLGLQTGHWPSSEGFLLLGVTFAIALAWIGMGEAAWRYGWRRVGVTLLALSTLGVGLCALLVMSLLMSVGAVMLSSSAFWDLLPAMMRENAPGWLTLGCLLGSLVILGRSLRRRERSAASTFCNILAATLLMLMVLMPTVPPMLRALGSMH
jgi:hypothetical protein